MDKPRVKVPKQVRRGEPFEVKALLSHKMESGQRKDEASGKLFPRMIVHSFVCRLDGAEVLRVKLHPAVSANPYFSFYVTAEKSGELEFEWEDDDGQRYSTRQPVEVVE